MQACLEDTALSLLESSSVPLRDAALAWTIRLARPVSANRNELAQELCGVPKAALRRVFGKLLGNRLWQQSRATTATAPTNNKTSLAAAISTRPSAALIADNALISDAEIRDGMLRYLCKEAAETLQERKRLAKSIALTVQYSNGESETAHQLLLRLTNEPESLEAAAHATIRGMRSNAFVSLKLHLTATQA